MPETSKPTASADKKELKTTTSRSAQVKDVLVNELEQTRSNLQLAMQELQKSNDMMDISNEERAKLFNEIVQLKLDNKNKDRMIQALNAHIASMTPDEPESHDETSDA